MTDSSIIPGFESVEEYCKAACQASLLCARTSRVIDLDLYEYYNTFKDFRESLAKQKDVALSLITGLIPGQKVKDSFTRLDEDEQLDLLKDVNASILENVSYLLDETGGEKAPEIELVVAKKDVLSINTSWNKKNFAQTRKSDASYSLLSAKNIPRPQFSFAGKIDNSSAIFVPIIKEKPNSIKPLAVTLEKNEEGEEEFCHPYEWEINKFEPSADLLEMHEPIKPRVLRETPLVHVKTREELNLLCEQLKKEKEFALDLEHHSFRSFQGFACLLQISTRDVDYIIDGLSLRSDLAILNEVFTDPKITKVLHGADMDILWLQRDYGLYVVNMFDTGQAARVLNLAHLSLAHLLKQYCNVQPDKQYQLADWRIRPLPEELINYARQDTHYLLYIYDCMKEELIKKGNKLKNLLISVFHRSKFICLKKYKKLVFTDEKYLDLYKKSRKNFNPRQLFCLKELYNWRDKIARLEDESYGYILPNHMLIQISEVLPREHQGILACCNPIPPLVQQSLNDISSVISKANNSSLAQMETQQKAVVNHDLYSTVDLNNMLHCPHDIHSYDDNRMEISHNTENLPDKEIRMLLKEKSTFLFHQDVDSSKGNLPAEHTAQAVIENIKKNVKGVYERYLLTKKYRTALGPDEEEQATSQQTEKNSKDFIMPVEIVNLDGSINEAESASSNHATPSQEITESTKEDEEVTTTPEKTSNRERKKNKGKKKKRAYIEILDTPTSAVEEDNSPKKSKAQEQNKSTLFQPFDYHSTKFNAATATPKNKKQQHFKRSQQHPQNATPGPSRHRDRRNKAKSFNGPQKGGKRKWPSM